MVLQTRRWCVLPPVPQAWPCMARPSRVWPGQGPEHLFVRKYALFESGRWPLGVVGGLFYLF